MTCFHPLTAYRDTVNGGVIFEQQPGAWEKLQLACGQCKGCRIDKSKEWAARIVHEAHMHNEKCFITLTYNTENLPLDGSLNKRHFQLFMKRLRKHYNDKKIRFFHCGEYGEQMDRPHYHACLFGVDFTDRVPHSVSNGVVTYVSDTLEKIWGKGFCTVGELEYASAAYCARYIMKKITGDKAEDHYRRTVISEYGEVLGEFQLQPEYITMSLGRKPGQGIGGSFYEKYKSDFYPSDECPVPGRGVHKKVPKYYDRLLEADDPETFNQIKQRRSEFHDKHAHDFTPQRLAQREKVKEAQLQKLPRT